MKTIDKVLAVIPARGGSKGLPGKNIRPLAGKPLIAWTIEAALECGLIDTVIVSTDDPEIASVARNFGAKVPFLRPECLATDNASSIDVLLHAIDYFNDLGHLFEHILLLQPTSPLRTKDDIYAAFDLMQKKNANAIISVCEVDHHPFWMNILKNDLSMENFEKQEYASLGRQQLPVYYRINGAIYLATTSFFKTNGFNGPGTFAYIMKKENSIDIDDILDFKLSEILINDKQNES